MPIKNNIAVLSKSWILAFALLLTGSVFGVFLSHDSGSRFYPAHRNFAERKDISKAEAMNRLKEKVQLAEEYVDEKGFDVSYCFLIDMRLPSGKNRFFVYNMLKDSLELSGLVTHGKGSENGSDDLIFSNKPNSNCTSLGKYKMGNSYNGLFGLSYKLHGLEKSNDNAFQRSVVLHCFNGVPNKEVYPNQICVSEGCPTVSPEFFDQLKILMDEAQEPILLWIYY
ncbi:MAG: murein L,D-transpeptidase catalytic domain-containing protein [Ferruginibacter sp.]